eukprot:TRINITY_DN8482_c0_g1_i1.p1 TRINITY_DN8482_c0_g1~~TRINITY_DN8482_c0_g1_i1.p1  ORF type:complete len:415 (-),score=93.06 TRINITY_DN8482_c0_g1_i1:62-1306(-)
MAINIPTENVGSIPRPVELVVAIADYDDGNIELEDLQEEQENAAFDTIKRMEATGQLFVTDGEQRSSSFATYPLTDTLAGTGLVDNMAPDGQFFAIFDDGHNRQLPRLVSGPFRYKTYAVDYLIQSMRLATKPMKQSVIAPSMMSLLYPLEGELEGYSKEEFLEDVCNECEKDIRQCFAAGAVRVSMDFTEGRLALKKDPRNPWTGLAKLKEFIDLNNRLLDRFTAEERVNIGIHTCPGGDCDSIHSGEVDYAELLPDLFLMNAGYFLIQCASEKDKERVYKLIGENRREDANGVPQYAFIGVINPLNPIIETPEQVCHDLLTAAKYIPPNRLGATDDCGFSPFSVDIKPKHGSPTYARDVAFQKIKNRVEGARLASEILSKAVDQTTSGSPKDPLPTITPPGPSSKCPFASST